MTAGGAVFSDLTHIRLESANRRCDCFPVTPSYHVNITLFAVASIRNGSYFLEPFLRSRNIEIPHSANVDRTNRTAQRAILLSSPVRGVASGSALGLGLAPGVCVGVAVGVATGSGVGSGVGPGVGSGVGVGLGVGSSVGLGFSV